MFGGLIHNALCSGGSSGKDPRIAALERATEFGRFVIPGTAGEDVWELSWRYTEELNGHHISQYSGSSVVFSHYYELYTWAVYLKNGEFRFALPNTVGYGHTCIKGDYRKNDEDNSIYREFERESLGIDISNLSLNETSNLPGPWGVYISGAVNGTEKETYYNSDGTMRSQRTYNISATTSTSKIIDSYNYTSSSLAIIRNDYQTYINDIFDMTKPNFAEN